MKSSNTILYVIGAGAALVGSYLIYNKVTPLPDAEVERLIDDIISAQSRVTGITDVVLVSGAVKYKINGQSFFTTFSEVEAQKKQGSIFKGLVKARYKSLALGSGDSAHEVLSTDGVYLIQIGSEFIVLDDLTPGVLNYDSEIDGDTAQASLKKLVDRHGWYNGIPGVVQRPSGGLEVIALQIPTDASFKEVEAYFNILYDLQLRDKVFLTYNDDAEFIVNQSWIKYKQGNILGIPIEQVVAVLFPAAIPLLAIGQVGEAIL